jgi:AcrR family transcriptional regulator
MGRLRTRRPYDNRRRSTQALKTRRRILDATLGVMARGRGDLSIPEIARAAGVAVRTVYRNFPEKRRLLAALDVHLDARIGYNLAPYPRNVEELAGHVRRYFRALDGMDAAIRTARTSGVARDARNSAGLSRKLEAVAAALETATARTADRDHARLFRIVATLFSQFTLQRMKDDLGLTADQAADTVLWAIRACVGAATAAEPTDSTQRAI